MSAFRFAWDARLRRIRNSNTIVPAHSAHSLTQSLCVSMSVSVCVGAADKEYMVLCLYTVQLLWITRIDATDWPLATAENHVRRVKETMSARNWAKCLYIFHLLILPFRLTRRHTQVKTHAIRHPLLSLLSASCCLLNSAEINKWKCRNKMLQNRSPSNWTQLICVCVRCIRWLCKSNCVQNWMELRLFILVIATVAVWDRLWWIWWVWHIRLHNYEITISATRDSAHTNSSSRATNLFSKIRFFSFTIFVGFNSW